MLPLRAIVLWSLLLASQFSFAYPELVRHGYVSCLTCHVSPSGGGVLTQYGRSLAKELVSFKKPVTDGDENPPPERWHFGGEARELIFHLNNEYVRSERFIPMELLGDVSYDREPYAFVIRAGLNGKGEENVGFQAASAYGLYRMSDKWIVRAGRFLPGYGLNNSMHFIGTRGDLGFGFDDQRQGLEFTYAGETFGAMAAAFTARDENIGQSAEMAQVQFSPTENSRFAVNYWHEDNVRDLYGIWGITPLFGPLFYTGDWNWQRELEPKISGYYYFNKIGYELRQGLNLIAISDNSKRDVGRAYTRIDRYGPGVQIFPRANFDFEVAWLREKNRLYANNEGDYAYILLHAYY